MSVCCRHLAERLGVSERKVQFWFQNQRQRERRVATQADKSKNTAAARSTSHTSSSSSTTTTEPLPQWASESSAPEQTSSKSEAASTLAAVPVVRPLVRRPPPVQQAFILNASTSEPDAVGSALGPNAPAAACLLTSPFHLPPGSAMTSAAQSFSMQQLDVSPEMQLSEPPLQQAHLIRPTTVQEWSVPSWPAQESSPHLQGMLPFFPSYSFQQNVPNLATSRTSESNTFSERTPSTQQVRDIDAVFPLDACRERLP
eukprot:1167567-Pleurochrysis_carterae.AAC.2